MIPDFQTIMLPLLKKISNGNEYKLDEIVNLMAKEFEVTDEERKELLPTGQTFVFGSRVSWARTYMKKAGLIVTPITRLFENNRKGIECIETKSDWNKCRLFETVF